MILLTQQNTNIFIIPILLKYFYNTNTQMNLTFNLYKMLWSEVAQGCWISSYQTSHMAENGQAEDGQVRVQKEGTKLTSISSLIQKTKDDDSESLPIFKTG